MYLLGLNIVLYECRLDCHSLASGFFIFDLSREKREQ